MKLFYTSLLFAILLFSSCTTPFELYENGDYKAAIRKAESQIKKGKDLRSNINVVAKAYESMISEAISQSHSQLLSDDVKEWIKVRKRYYNLLEDIGKSNQVTDGKLTGTFDQLCDVKVDLDFKIASKYYEDGEDYLAKYTNSGLKVDAQKACLAYEASVEHGGREFYNDLSDKIEYSWDHGIVYFQAHDVDVREGKFLRHSYDNAIVDCVLYGDYGWPSLNIISRNSDRDTRSREIQVGTETETDTAGVVTTTPIYETVEATVVTTTITVQASIWIDINVRNVSGQCPLRDESEEITYQDSYEEVSWSGDVRAFNGNPPNQNSGPPIGFESDLRRRIENEARDWSY